MEGQRNEFDYFIEKRQKGQTGRVPRLE